MRETYQNDLKRKRGRLGPALLVLILACVLAGCGKDEDEAAMSAAARIQEEEAGEKAADETEDAGAQEGSLTPREEEAEEGSDIDEETRHQLTAELLEENELDTSVMEIEHATRGCVFGVPAGFKESEETPGLYVTDRYPIDTSMIYYEVMDRDVSLQLLTAELFKEQAEENLSEAYGEDITVNVESFESVKISGYPAFRILCSYETEGLTVTQLEYAINADKSYMITYTQTDEYDRMEEYEASAATIKVR